MGWKVSAVIINTIDEEVNFEKIINAIGFNNLGKIDELPFDSAIYPDRGNIYIGVYKGNLILTAQDLPLYFISEETNQIEKRFATLFPDAEVCALSLDSTVNHWAFSVSQKGKKIRAKAGDMNAGTIIDLGQPLSEEAHFLSFSRRNSEGQREYDLANSGEFVREDQVGENIVFEIAKRYTGKNLDEDDELFDTMLWGYKSLSFSGPGLADLIYCGEWSGFYTYGQGYRDSIKGTTSNFSIEIEAENGTIKGTSKEEDKETAIINGFIVDEFIGFVHQYPNKYSFNSEGESTSDPALPGSKVFYTGLFDQQTSSFRGIWRINGRNNWGEWFMKKSDV